MVGRLRTMATMVVPEMRLGNIQPMVLTKGLMAMRVGYFSTRRVSGRPLARAAST